MNVNDIKIFSFFSGSGILDLGFERNGYEVVMANEYYEPFMKAYNYSRSRLGIKKPRFGNICCDINDFLGSKHIELSNNINILRKEQKIVGFIGGPPCPDFSIAGKQAGRNGDNGKLSLSYVKLIVEMKPDFFLFENVKGLWRTTKHREFFEELKNTLHDSDYVTTEKLVNSLEYGVPQDRERIILIGFRRHYIDNNKISGSLINNFPWERNIKYNLKEVLSKNWPTTSPFIENSVITCPKNIIIELTIDYWFRLNSVYNHFNSNDFFTPRAGIIKMRTINEGDTDKKSYKRLHRYRYSPTAAYGNNEVHLHPNQVRRISAAEAMAIQSLPPEFELPNDMSLTNKFKTIGNGVPYLLSYGISRTLLDYMEAM